MIRSARSLLLGPVSWLVAVSWLIGSSAQSAAAQSAQWLEQLAKEDVAQRFEAVSRALQSGDLRDVTWGAHAAGELGLRSAQSELRATLRRLADVPPEDRERTLAARALLDALIRLRIPVAAPDLEVWLRGGTFGAAFVLLTREPIRNRAALQAQIESNDSRSRGRELVFLSCGHLLAAQRAPGFARYCLEQLRPRLELFVYDADGNLSGGAGGSIGTRFGSGRGFVPADFPPTPTWELRALNAPSSNAPLAADGREPTAVAEAQPDVVTIARPFGASDGRKVHRHFAIEAQRTEHGPGRYAFGGGDRPPEPVRHCRGWLRGLAGLAELPFQERSYRSIDMREADYLTVAVGARSELDEALQSFVDRLVESGALTPPEASTLTLQVEVVVNDQRRDKSTELPPLPARD